MLTFNQRSRQRMLYSLTALKILVFLKPCNVQKTLTSVKKNKTAFKGRLPVEATNKGGNYTLTYLKSRLFLVLFLRSIMECLLDKKSETVWKQNYNSKKTSEYGMF